MGFKPHFAALARRYPQAMWLSVDTEDPANREIGAAFREVVGHYAIAMTAVQVVALIEDRAKVEIETRSVAHEPSRV